MSDELNKEPKDGAELENAELENITGGAVSLNFTKIETVYTPQKPDGSGGASSPSGWDIKANKAS